MTGRDRTPTDGPTTVVHLITTLTQGGAERVLSQVVPRPGDAPGERHVVVSLVEGGMFADVLRAAGVEVRDLGMRPGRDVVRGTRRLAALLRELRPTVIIAWMYHACLLAMLARPLAGAAGRTRLVWTLRGALHAPETLSRSTRRILPLLARTSHIPDAVAINSHAGRTDHERVGFRPRRWVHLPNGCDTHRFRPDATDRSAVRSEFGVTTADALILFVGRAHPEKGIDVLLDALPLIAHPSPLTVVLAGAGTDGLSSTDGTVRRVGIGDRDDIDRLLRGADALVLPSRTEGMPNAVIEAMATGVPCVVTDVGDTAELVGDTGVVVPPGSPAAIAAGLRDLLAMDAASRAQLGDAARERVAGRHDLATARAEYRSLWSEVA